jgi:nitrite reductase (NADH) small subunit
MDEVGWITVARAEEIAPRKARVIRTGDGNVAVFRTEDGGLYAIEDRCPHRGAPLSAGLVYDNDKVACGDHGWSIRLADGGVEPPECGKVRTFPVKVEDGVVLVQCALPEAG